MRVNEDADPRTAEVRALKRRVRELEEHLRAAARALERSTGLTQREKADLVARFRAQA